MATSQSTLDSPKAYGVHEFALGDCLTTKSHGKLILTECPLCAADPDRPRHHFRPQESRPAHIQNVHAGEW